MNDITDNDLLTLYVHRIQFETETIRSFELRREDGAALPPYAPGAHIDIRLPDGAFRSYSLTGAETDGHGEIAAYDIAVSRHPESRGGSSFMCETLRVGDRLTVRAPSNLFELADGEAPSILFAGGIGITPVMAMIRALERAGRPWILHYAARSRRHAAFLAAVSVWQGAGAGSVHLHFDDEHDGRPLDVTAACAAAPSGAHFYCCGPTPMIEAFQRALSALPPEQVHVEHFSGVAEAVAERSFQLCLKRSKKEFTVPQGRSIMQVLEENDVFVPHSCREGVCGTCETRVLEGIPDHHDKLLSDRERASNRTMMLCCSGSKTDRLVLDL